MKQPANLRDGLYQRELLMRVADAGDGLNARFDFVIDIRDTDFDKTTERRT